ncbi:hypothetical protein D9757_009346 [Collybiopsis confluens]|uniref:Uncharacterized protein n=1 Tax=Collybiopsis confluens TaxID=2823264 RepID=A0A8H5H3Q8_9AGAR|nr:hypothetical protein D9757_009346 [Collybiopsis confluens]
MAGNYNSPQSSGGLKKLKLMEEMVKSIEAKIQASALSLYGIWTKTLSRELRVVLNIISDEQAQAPKERKLEILQQLDDILQNLSEIMTDCGQLMDELHCRSKMTVLFMTFRRAGDLKRIKELRAEVKSTKAEVECRFIRLKSAWPKPAEPAETRSEERLSNQQRQRLEMLSMNAPSVASRASTPLATSTTNLNSATIYDGRFSTSGRDTYLVYDYSQTTIIHHHGRGACPNEVAEEEMRATSYGLVGLGRMR